MPSQIKRRRLLAAISLATMLALFSASAASAKIYLRGLDGRTVRGGQVVRVFVPACEGNPTCERAMRGIAHLHHAGGSQSLGKGRRAEAALVGGEAGQDGSAGFPRAADNGGQVPADRVRHLGF